VGDLHLVRISSRDPAPPPLAYVAVSGGIFLDMTIHDFDMARFVVGSEVEEVYAQGAVRITPEIAEHGDVDTAVVQLRHANGCLTVIDNSRQAVYGFDQRVEAFGSAGVAVSENPLAHTGLLRTVEGSRAAPLPHFFVERYTQSFIDEWAAFRTAVRHGGPSEVGGADGRAPLVIGLAAWRSLREHRPVPLAEIDAP
jgi:myo-inositol 2-dehydrogenase/D-chiro-inositol 1-dehydrogenase